MILSKRSGIRDYEHKSLDAVVYVNGRGYRQAVDSDKLVQRLGTVYLLPDVEIDGVLYYQEFDVPQSTHIGVYWSLYTGYN